MNRARLKEWMDAERPAWTAAIVLAVPFIFIGINNSNVPNEGESVSISGRISFTIEVAVFAAYLVFLVRCIRGPIKAPNFKPPLQERRLGVWGYVWRSLIVTWLSVIPIASTIILFGGDSVALYTMGTIVSFLAPAVLCWLLFGHERVQFLKKMFFYFRYSF